MCCWPCPAFGNYNCCSMLGIYTLVSIVSVFYPLLTSVSLLIDLHKCQLVPLAALTDTVPVSMKIINDIQIKLFYWILLSFWLMVIQLNPINFIIRIIPFSELLIIYVQIWLGFNIVPYADNSSAATTNNKVSGSFIIYHYYFDENMKNLQILKNLYMSVLINIINSIFNFLDNIPIINLSQYKVLIIKQLNSFNGSLNNAGDGSIGNGNSYYDLANGLYDFVYGFVKPQNHSLNEPISSVVISSLLSPFNITSPFSGGDINKTFNSHNMSTFTATAVATATATTATFTENGKEEQNSSQSPSRSFDDFDIVNKKDIEENYGGELKVKKRSSSNHSNASNNVSNNASNIHNDKSNNDGSRKASGSSSVFSLKNTGRARNVSRSSWFG